MTDDMDRVWESGAHGDWTKPAAAPMTWPAAVCFLGLLVLLGWVAWLALT